MKALKFSFVEGSKATLTLVGNQPMVTITAPNQSPMTLPPTSDVLLYFGLQQELIEMIEWLALNDLVDRLQFVEDGYNQNAFFLAQAAEAPTPHKIKI